MQTASLDILEKTQLPPSQARAILQAMELEIAARGEPFVTRAELKEGLHSLESRIESLRSDFSLKIEALRSEMNIKFEAARGDTKAIEGKLTRWVFTCALSQTAIMAGALYFSLTHLRPFP